MIYTVEGDAKRDVKCNPLFLFTFDATDIESGFCFMFYILLEYYITREKKKLTL